jgi:hypothetical protein
MLGGVADPVDNALSHHLPGVVEALELCSPAGLPGLSRYWEGLSSPILGNERGTHKLFGLTLL